MQEIFDQLIFFVGISSLAYLIAEGAEPVEKIKKYIFPDNTTNEIMIFMRDLFSCTKCIGFWIGIISYMDIPKACAVAIFAQIICLSIQPRING